MNLALGLPRLPRAARRQLASRAALHAWLLGPPASCPQSAALGTVSRRQAVGMAATADLGDRRARAAGPEIVGPKPPGRRLKPAVLAVAAAALRTQSPWSAGSIRVALRTGPDAAAVAWVLRGREEVAGVLVGIDDTPAPRPPDVVGVGEALWADVLEPMGLALARVRHVNRLEELATIDDLTGLFNARHLQSTVERELSRLARTGRPLSLVFLDLDAFKSVNDRHGHLLGSDAHGGGAPAGGLRPPHRHAGRYGGDEFVVVLPGRRRRNATGVAERIRNGRHRERSCGTGGGHAPPRPSASPLSPARPIRPPT